MACFAGLAMAAIAAADGPPPPTGPTLFTRPGGILGQTLRFRGSLGSDQAGRTVAIERQQLDGTWAPTATAVIATDGSFIARWRTDEVGRFTVRALIDGADAQAAAAVPPTTAVTVYKPARATFFGPGFYGRRTACGQVMSHALIGVAHRTLPCGTQVDVFYAGRTVTVPVVDRGPFANGASYDLTSAAAQALGMTQTSTVGVAPSRSAPLAPVATLTPTPYTGTGGIAPTV
ncbi:MAG: rare lipoprotein [Solirubrobacteraceae bacterium]|jgi:hypothetical protein|nr:rare lipoprotein [Solirubrobacteraceae bacterium]